MNHQTSRPIIYLFLYGNLIVVLASFLSHTGATVFRGAALVIFGMALARLAEYSGRNADRSEQERKPEEKP